MAINPNWDKWIKLSIAKHFDDRKNGYSLYIEGQDRPPDNPQQGVELRCNGPFTAKQVNREWSLDIIVNTLLKILQNDEDTTGIYKATGHFLNVFTQPIAIYKYGSEDDDDGSFIDCLRNRDGEIIVNNFGIMAPDVRLVQVTIDCIYTIVLKE